MRVRGLLGIVFAVPACFGQAPPFDPQEMSGEPMLDGSGSEASTGEVGGEATSGETGSDASSDGASSSGVDGPACAEAPPAGCVEVLHNGSFTEWFDGSPAPTGWVVPVGTSERVDDDACAPRMLLRAGPPDELDNVWSLEQDIADTSVPAGATLHFAATLERVSGEITEVKVCFTSVPDILCQFATGFDADGRTEVVADFVTTEAAELFEFEFRSKYTANDVLVDDLRLWVCSGG